MRTQQAQQRALPFGGNPANSEVKCGHFVDLATASPCQSRKTTSRLPLYPLSPLLVYESWRSRPVGVLLRRPIDFEFSPFAMLRSFSIEGRIDIVLIWPSYASTKLECWGFHSTPGDELQLVREKRATCVLMGPPAMQKPPRSKKQETARLSVFIISGVVHLYRLYDVWRFWLLASKRSCSELGEIHMFVAKN
jgi:hypothetical protein